MDGSIRQTMACPLSLSFFSYQKDMHIHHKQNILISEQRVSDTNPLFDLAYIPRDLPNVP